MTLQKEKIYDEQISPLMTQIIRICKENKIACFATYRLGFDEAIGEELSCSTSIPSDVDADNKMLGKLVKVVKEGYDVVPTFSAFTVMTK